MDDEKIITKLDEIIEEGREIARRVGFNDRSAKKFQISAKNLLKIRFGSDSIYYNEFLNTYKIKPRRGETYSDVNHRLVRLQTGVLEAVLDALKNGLTDDLFYQKELLVFSDLLEQAFEFYEKGITLATGIYGRIVLELTIKEFANKNGINSNMKFDQIIIKLRQKDIIHQNLETSLRANYLIGNWAAHGDEKFNELDNKEIKEFLVFIRDKVLNLN